jgi:hypothetical protein
VVAVSFNLLTKHYNNYLSFNQQIYLIIYNLHQNIFLNPSQLTQLRMYVFKRFAHFLIVTLKAWDRISYTSQRR